MEQGATFFSIVIKTDPYSFDKLLELLAVQRKYVTITMNLEYDASGFRPVGISRITYIQPYGG
jgi:hypothetical protein